MSTPRYTDVLFDLDGTLIDSAPAILASFRKAFDATGIPSVMPIEASVIGPPLVETLQLLSGTTDAPVIERLSAHFKKSYDSDGFKATTAYDGVEDMLRTLAGRGQRLYVATNKRIFPTRLILHHLGWDRLFKAVYALDLFDPRLADKAAMIERLMNDHALSVDHSVYVGDREEDGRSAAANALPFYAATWGYGSIRADEMEPDWHGVGTPAELLGALA